MMNEGLQAFPYFIYVILRSYIVFEKKSAAQLIRTLSFNQLRVFPLINLIDLYFSPKIYFKFAILHDWK